MATNYSTGGLPTKVVILASIIVVAVAALIFMVVRSNGQNDGASNGTVRQMKPGVRGKHAKP